MAKLLFHASWIEREGERVRRFQVSPRKKKTKDMTLKDKKKKMEKKKKLQGP